MMPFLTIVTGTYRRPRMLRRCIASVQAQSDPDYQQVFLTGDDESGIDGFHRRLGDEQHRYCGRYVYVLPDDDLLMDDEFIAGLKRICAEHDPDAVMVRADKLELGILPRVGWGRRPLIGDVDILNYVVRAEVWKRHSAAFAKTEYPYHNGAYAGDCSFIRDVFASGARVWWWDRLVARSQRISRGAPE